MYSNIFPRLMHLSVALSIIFSSCNRAGIDSVSVEFSTVWEERENNVDGYRIPGIVVTAKGTVLAFAEERPLNGDSDPKSIVLKRSSDGGLSWSENSYIEKSDGSFWAENKNKIAPEDDPEKLEVWTNPAAIVDIETGKVFIFYALSEGKVKGQDLQRYTRVFYKYSDDDGLTWSARTEITGILNSNEKGEPNKDQNGNWIADANGFPCDFLGRAFHMPGPGHGIQLRDGRLLLQIWNRKALGSLDSGHIPVEDREYGICTIFSDDHGKTWRYGSSFAHNGLNGSESRIVQLDDGSVYLNTRYVSVPDENNPFIQRNGHRMIAYSYDRGVTWEKIEIDKNFPFSNACDAGLVAYKHPDLGVTYLIYSKNEATGVTNGEGRINLVIRASSDDGRTWPLVKVIDPGPAAYSDLSVLKDNTIAIIYETTMKNGPVNFARFKFDWLTHPDE